MRHGGISYRAFISYSHADRACAEWLHRALENYRIPSKLVGDETPLGVVPARLGRIFKDRDELPAAGNLSAELQAALKASMFLIVIASPSAAKSRWVNEEVLQFKMMHGHRKDEGAPRVLALIAGGDPGDPGDGTCFPPALRFHVTCDGTITDEMAEPIAVDIRSGGDGKKLAKLKLVAGLTGLPLDSLVQREAARRQRQMGLLAGASLALVAVMAVLTVIAVQGRREAERQRAEADGLVEFMLTDLRQKLEPVGRLDVLDSVGQRALIYYEGQRLASLDADALGRRARALMLVGEVRDLNGDSAAAYKAYRAAERSTAELLARDPENADRMFDHAQSVFYVGQLAWQQRDWNSAEAHFRIYANLADRMLATDPANPKWLAEVGYAANSLGALYIDRRRPAEAIASFQIYVAVTGRLAAAAPDDADARWEASQARGWLADARFLAGDLPGARAERMAELGILSELRAEDGRNNVARMSMAQAQSALAVIATSQGDLGTAEMRARIAVADMGALVDQDPGNSLWRGIAVNAANNHAEALLLGGQWAKAARINSWALENAILLTTADPANRRTAITLLMPARWMQIAILYGQGRTVEARAGLARFRADFSENRNGDIALGATSPWLAIHMMESADLASSGNWAASRKQAAAADEIATPFPSPQQQALKTQLAALAKGETPSPRPGSGGYPAYAIVRAVRP
ncbi:MAG: toll/interleukin-1 receptor domain-containing protein [Sandarakinorhabdus sp.]|nr:toll/interleukin-1 receptor domain-containing protein [Sandarakinorhabdus sp.]